MHTLVRKKIIVIGPLLNFCKILQANVYNGIHRKHQTPNK